jgi:hypothetical protein
VSAVRGTIHALLHTKFRLCNKRIHSRRTGAQKGTESVRDSAGAGDEMLDNKSSLLIFFGICALVSFGGNTCLAQNSLAEFQKTLSDRASFTETDFVMLSQGQPVVKLLSARDKREVVVAGLVPLQAPVELFLQSFRESMTRKSNPAILEIGSFSSQPTIDDLQMLTFENRDLEDLRQCVVGDCRLKLSAAMIDRLQKEVDWSAPDYRLQVTQLLKLMLLDYVRDYLARGDAALIEYNDKQTAVRLADEQRDLMAALSHDVLDELPQYLKGSPNAELRAIEHALVWSKIKFGFKPVIAINHITIYQREQKNGPQILIASKQIYANHYFDSSLALTAFLSVPGASSGYLFYENRSRADGLGGAFSGLKRGIIENRALDGVKAILHQSRLSLEARALNGAESSAATTTEVATGRRWRVGRLQAFLLLVCIGALVLLVGLRSYNWKFISRTAH